MNFFNKGKCMTFHNKKQLSMNQRAKQIELGVNIFHNAGYILPNV